MKTGRYCCHQLLFQTHLHALFKTANFVTNMKFKGLQQWNLSTDSTVTAVIGLKFGVLKRPGVSVNLCCCIACLSSSLGHFWTWTYWEPALWNYGLSLGACSKAGYRSTTHCLLQSSSADAHGTCDVMKGSKYSQYKKLFHVQIYCRPRAFYKFTFFAR